MERHNASQATEWTKNRLPIKLVYTEKYTTLLEARTRERQITESLAKSNHNFQPNVIRSELVWCAGLEEKNHRLDLKRSTRRFFSEAQTPRQFWTNYSGEVAEWSMATVLKTVRVKALEGSNPSLSAIRLPSRYVWRVVECPELVEGRCRFVVSNRSWSLTIQRPLYYVER